ncbi:TetR family transcriptional regulator [Mycolicibacterium chubuense]|uniref:HTH-type transcriptional repressor NicS n=1 Tax=Mycolicibacterium chubuense TaxID=1800 RepID=A0A0J6ZF05_MYCCU|nr:TetR/AcrR family transcriptional regulator [Mycolicibacterium chubuense]KMO83386.1 HTH-type transcriptional repressor NicS [Mycolicibacterium chubuense]ORA47643.1 TetR family transcriptional regulator [Mycolicibacterium chubuense]SPY00360.1 transcriptional regulator [Mycolicibacterium chubuense]
MSKYAGGGLRQRKKSATRSAIRRAAIRLFQDQGYTDTTVEQIAEAAEVSPRTFYRYFVAKEAVLICDQAVPVMVAFRNAPADLSPVAAYRYAVAAYFDGLSDDERRETIVAQHLLYSLPEARGVLYAEYTLLIGLMTRALASRLGSSVTLTERRVIAGTIIGVLIAASDGNPLPEETLNHSLEILESKLAW